MPVVVSGELCPSGETTHLSFCVTWSSRVIDGGDRVRIDELQLDCIVGGVFEVVGLSVEVRIVAVVA